MKITKCELKLLLSIPMTYDILLAGMVANNLGTYGRKNEIKRHSDKMRDELGR